MANSDGGAVPVCKGLLSLEQNQFPKICVRGLDARVQLAQARVLTLLEMQAAEDMFFKAACEAQLQGIEDAKEGIDQPPLMFAGEELHLLRPWRWGRVFELERQCMCACAGCRNGTGNPCQVHG